MKTKVQLEATGDVATGKTLVLSNIKEYLEGLGLKVKLLKGKGATLNQEIENEHKLMISGEICEKCGGPK